MVLIEFDALAAQPYADFRYELMTDMWGNNFKPYVDHDGIPRIGPGIVLTDYISEVTLAITGSNYSTDLVGLLFAQASKNYDKGDTALLRQRLDKVMADWADEHGLPESFGTFEFANHAQSRQALADSMVWIEDALENWSDSGIETSEERAAIASLFQEGIRSTLQDNLMADLFASDRPAVWFDIRYMNSGFEGSTPSAGKEIAARRYLQSEAFELYNDPDNVSVDEAEAVGMLYSKYRDQMIRYEDRYDADELLPNGNGKGAGGNHGIAGQLQPAMTAIADAFDLEIGRMEELLFVVARSSTFDGDDPNDNFNSKKNDDDMIIGTLTADKISGGKGNDVIVGLAGNDKLFGGKGNDNLYGGENNDRLEGGDGNDKLWGGGGTDTLIGGKGNDRYVLGDDDELDPEGGGSPSLIGGANSDKIAEAKNGGTDTLVIQVDAGNFNFRHVERFKMADDIPGSVTVKLNEFDSFELSSGDDDLTLVINRLQKTPIEIKTGAGKDEIHIKFAGGVDPSQVLDGKGLTARFKFNDLSASDTIDLTSIGIEDIVMKRDKVDVDKGFYLLAPGAKLDLMDGNKIDKTYNNYTDNWFVVKLGDDTPFGPEFIGNIDKSHFDI